MINEQLRKAIKTHKAIVIKYFRPTINSNYKTRLTEVIVLIKKNKRNTGENTVLNDVSDLDYCLSSL